LVEAYKRLAELKLKKPWSEVKHVPGDVHRQILRQLYGVDINEFPAHLTAINLAMKNVRAPTTDANIVTADFFKIMPKEEFSETYTVTTPSGLKRKEIAFPSSFDVVTGNPPYTRWNDLPEHTRQRILQIYGKVLRDYKLHKFATGGAIPGIFIPWIIHSANFLKEGGRLGMIISDSWLQTEYGVAFLKYLADTFKIHAIIDISSRVFPVPLIGSCIILLERCSNQNERDSNMTVLMLTSGKRTLEVDAILEAIKKAKDGVKVEGEGFLVNTVKQSELKNITSKPITLFFNVEEIFQLLMSSGKTVKLGNKFQPSEGNTGWSVYASMEGKGAGVGGENFYYLSEEDVRKYGLKKYVGIYLKPLISSPDNLKYFVFTKEDWEKKKEYILIANKPLSELPQEIKEYVKLGETSILLTKGTNKGKPVSQSAVALIRKNLRKVEVLGRRIFFLDWYDLGGVIEAPIYVARGSQYWVRFVLAKYQCALDDRVLALIPRQGVKFDEIELKALLAYLNSSFAQLQAEVMGRSTGGGMIELDVKPLNNFVILDVKRLPREDIEVLAKLFDELDSEARRLGGADAVENVFGSEVAKDLTGREYIKEGVPGLFNTVIKEIDEKIGEILHLEALVEPVRAMVIELARRRLSRAAEAKPGALRGSEELSFRRGKHKKRRSENDGADTGTMRLTDFM
jgi:type I restriction-modification system DNA methylase subunit